MKEKAQYRCSSCNQWSQKWWGRCPHCAAWNTLEPATAPTNSSISDKKGLSLSLQTLEKRSDTHQKISRLRTGISELDRVLGGGLVPDSFILLGGDPGIGKSTLVLQMASALAKQTQAKVLYLSGEESFEQIARRAQRLKLSHLSSISFHASNHLETAFHLLEKCKPQVLIIDSLQTFTTQTHPSAAGTVSQIREVGGRLLEIAKKHHLAVLLIGHVTKEGTLAGPKMIEHLVDTVLYFEGDRYLFYRFLRARKNRFGNIQELGVFEMTQEGLKEVLHPSSLFIQKRDHSIAGITTSCVLEGSRPLLLEIEALVVKSPLQMPRRTTLGMDPNRIHLILAVIERFLHIPLSTYDLYINIAGGLRTTDPALDLGVLLAILSSFQNIALPFASLCLGEMSLTGEIRSVPLLENRLQEAKKLGFEHFFLPKQKISKKRFASQKTTVLTHVQEVAPFFANHKKKRPSTSTTSSHSALPFKKAHENSQNRLNLPERFSPS